VLHIYKSSAGSGKTYTLVREYLRMALARPDKFKHILAITFTNKAANEMKGRIIGTLQQISRNEEKIRPLITELARAEKMDEAIVIDKAGKILQNLLHNYSDFSVSTIDSFVHRVIRAFAHDLELAMNFEIELDTAKLLNETVEILMDRIDDVDNAVTNAVLEYAETNIEEGKSWNLEHSLMKLGKELFKEDAYAHIDKLSKFSIEDLLKHRDSLFKFKTAFENKVTAEAQKAVAIIKGSGLDEKAFYQGSKGIYGYFIKLSDGINKADDITGNSYVQKTLGEDKWYSGSADEGDKKRIDAIKDRLLEAYSNISTLFDKQGSDYWLSKLLIANFYSFTLLTEIHRLLEEYKQENNMLHISDFQRMIFKIVREQDAPVIYERIGEWYDNILIDEFQDTSVLQWQNLLPLVENAQFKTEDSLVVGDGKQAIYRFRGGVVEQFAMLPKIYGSNHSARIKEREVAIQNYGTAVKHLDYNYRSRNEVIAFNNDLFNTLRDIPELADKSIYEDAEQKPGLNKADGYVSIEFLAADGEEEETTLDDNRCNRVSEIVKQCLERGYSYSDISVLTRSNSNASVIASYLLQNGIKVVSPESLIIDQSPKVKLITSMLGYFDAKDNHIARAEVVYYIHLLVLKQETRFEQYNFKNAYSEFEELVSVLMGKVFNSNHFTHLRLQDMVHELVSWLGFDQSDPFLQFFSDEVMLFLNNNRSNIREFLNWWDEVKSYKSIIYPESLDAVRVMTIHKSKGLQFPIVIMADADWDQKNTRDMLWLDMDKEFIKGLDVGVVGTSSLLEETEFAHLYRQEVNSSFLDMLNLVYVATTRAEDMLFILSSEMKKMPAANKSVASLFIYYLQQKQLWDGFKQYEFGNPNTTKIAGKPKHNEDTIYTRGESFATGGAMHKIGIRKSWELMYTPEQRDKIVLGNLVHNVLKQVRKATDINKVVSRMYNEGSINVEQKEQLTTSLTQVVNMPDIAKYFEAPYECINERPLVTAKGDIKVPDRVVMKDDEAVVIDFKTGMEWDGHKQQLQAYAKELENLGFKKIKKYVVYTELKLVSKA
jgi:ATP-dependent helicase/nuclease subunit A